MEKSAEKQHRDLQAGREEGRRLAAASAEGPWSANPDYSRGVEEGHRDHRDTRQAADVGVGMFAVVLAVLYFFVRAIWHMLTNPGEGLLHYGAFILFTSRVFDSNIDPLYGIAVGVAAPIVAVSTFRWSLRLMRNAEIEIDRFLCRQHIFLGYVSFYLLLVLSTTAGVFLVFAGADGGTIKIILFNIPTTFACAAVVVIATGTRLFCHPLSHQYNPLLRRQK